MLRWYKYIIKVANFSLSSQFASKIKRTPQKWQNWCLSLFNWFLTIVKRSTLKFVIQRVVNHFSIMFPTRDITVQSFHNCDVTTHGPNKRGKILVYFWRHGVILGSKRQKYLLKLEIIKYKCHSDNAMSSFWF